MNWMYLWKNQDGNGDTDLCPYDGEHGAQDYTCFGPNMRVAAAEAKGVLLELASAQLNVPVFSAGN